MTATISTVPAPPDGGVTRLIWVGLVTLIFLYAAFYLYQQAQPVFGAVLLALATGFAIIFGANRYYSARFIFPGVAAVLIFFAFPVGYTIYLGFTNYLSFNLLTYDRTIEVLTARGAADPATEQPFAVAPDGANFRIWLPDAGLLSDPVPLSGISTAVLAPATAPADLPAPRDAIKLREGLQGLTLTGPDGVALVNSGLRTFASVTPEFRREGAETLIRAADGAVLTADHSTGFFVGPDGEQVPPGWRVGIGFGNFEGVFTSAGMRGPMLQIFIWTVTFAALSVLLTFALGLTLAVILQWPHLRFKTLYRILLILPYAVPAFISILVFRGLFNQNFREINLVLEGLFGIRPTWFTDVGLARVMLLIVNTWLGYPYMMLLAMGFLQAVPEDHKRAAALEGASSLRVFFTITLPQILPPFLPLLIALFAFNFNSLVLVLLLTMGGPDIPGTIIPAGGTDILASFTSRMAFDDSGTQFGLAGAITLLIFVVVAAISYLNFVAMRRATLRRRAKGTIMIVERPADLRLKKILAHRFMINFLALILFPFLTVASISFRKGNFTQGNFWPEHPTLEHWYLAFGLDYTRADGTVVSPPCPVLLWMWNSIKIGLIAGVGVLTISTVSAYAFSRIKIRGKQGLLDSLFLIQMFPTTLALVAIYAIFDALGEVTPVMGLDSHAALIVIYMSGVTLHI